MSLARVLPCALSVRRHGGDRLVCFVPAQLDSGAVLSEVEIDKQLTGRRAAKPGFIECSFPTIAGALLILASAHALSWLLLASAGLRADPKRLARRVNQIALAWMSSSG